MKIESTICLSVVNSGSRYPAVIPLTSTTSASIIGKLMEIFARFGLPKIIVTDDWPRFVSTEWNGFCLVWTLDSDGYHLLTCTGSAC